MTREEFDKLVQRIESGTGKDLRALRWRVAGLACLGYFYLLAGLVVVAAVAAGCFFMAWWADPAGKFVFGLCGALILFGGGAAILRTLLVKIPEPDGVAVDRAQVPGLFSMLDELGARLNCKPFYRVQLTFKQNAGVVQIPRLGALGWSRSYLLLGLPLLDGCSREEIRAVLAHEFAHLSRNHGRFFHWIYRLRKSWEALFQQAAASSHAGQSFRPLLQQFIKRFWPGFNAHAFVLSRAMEYEADSTAVRVAGAEHLANSLVRIQLQEMHLDHKFWPNLWQEAKAQAEPPSNALGRLSQTLSAAPESEEASRWRGEAFCRPTTNSDTHPCLSDRLRAIGQLPATERLEERFSLFAAPKPSAAEELLGDSAGSLREKVELTWRGKVMETWKARHAKVGALAERLTALNQAVPEMGANPDALWDRAALVMADEGLEKAEPLLSKVLALRPDHINANYHLGRAMLARGDAEGERYLETAVEQEDQLLPHACEVLQQYYHRIGRMDKFREIELRLDAYERHLAASRSERVEVTVEDTFIPHGLDDGQLRSLQETLAAHADLVWVETARKQLRHFPKQKLFVMCIRRRPAWHRLPDSDRDRALISKLSLEVKLPGRMLIITASGGYKGLARKISRVPGAKIFERF